MNLDALLGGRQAPTSDTLCATMCCVLLCLMHVSANWAAL